MRKIWSPVILAQLHPERALTFDRQYQLDKRYHSIEELKVKARGCEAAGHGKYVECLIRLQVVALLGQPSQEPELVRYHDEIKEWVPAHCFDPPMKFNPNTDMIVEVEKIACGGELREDLLKVQAHVNYTVLATQNEAITLAAAPWEAPLASLPPPGPPQAIVDTIRDLEGEVRRLSQDNAALGHRIMLHEKNLLGLRNALRRAEQRSHALLRELSQSSRLVQALEERIKEKDNLRRESARASRNPSSAAEAARLPLGDRIRQLFASS